MPLGSVALEIVTRLPSSIRRFCIICKEHQILGFIHCIVQDHVRTHGAPGYPPCQLIMKAKNTLNMHTGVKRLQCIDPAALLLQLTQ